MGFLARGLRWRSSVLARLLLVCLVMTGCAVAATAWVSVSTATTAIHHEQDQRVVDSARIYTTLVRYAATHSRWQGVAPVVSSLAASNDYRVTLLSADRTVIADSSASGPPLPKVPSALVDPLNVDVASSPDTGSERISPDAVGPYRLSGAERSATLERARKALDCIRGKGGSGAVFSEPNGHAQARSPMLGLQVQCSVANQLFTKTEGAAVGRLETLADECLRDRGEEPVELKLVPSDRTSVAAFVRGPGRSTLYSPYTTAPAAVSDCVGSARRDQLRPYVSPAALLFITSPDGAAPQGLNASVSARIIGASALVLLVGVGITVVIARRMSRPLRQLTSAAGRMRGGDLSVRVDVRGRDEIGQLGTAFNAMAEARHRLEELRKTMVADIAHELRTPVSNIRGWLESVEDGISKPDPALVSSLLGQAVQLQHIISDLQDLALADAGHLALHRETLWTTDLLRTLVTAHGAQASAAGIDLSLRGDETLELYADGVRLRQALGNLVSNAIRYTPAGGSVVLGARRSGDSAVFEVADTGTGIDAKDLPHVFDRFWRAEKSRNRVTGGSGLGLAIARGLVRAHGGGITVTSTPGVGTAFSVTVPLPTDQAAAAAGHSGGHAAGTGG